MSKWQPYNPNPIRNRTIDCTVRAIAKATGEDWDTIYTHLSFYGFMYKDVAISNDVWGKYLKSKGFKRYLVDDKDQDYYTVEDFCQDHPTGTYILAIDGHVVCVADGKYYDSWDSGKEIPLYYWARG